MNDFMKAEVVNMRFIINNFLQRLEYAALQDDERISADESKTMKRIQKASNRYLRDLEKTF